MFVIIVLYFLKNYLKFSKCICVYGYINLYFKKNLNKNGVLLFYLGIGDDDIYWIWL